MITKNESWEREFDGVHAGWTRTRCRRKFRESMDRLLLPLDSGDGGRFDVARSRSGASTPKSESVQTTPTVVC